MFVVLALVFFLAMALSTALAAAAMVDRNEKPIAVMRAFGYSWWHVFVLLFGQLGVLLVVAFILFSALLAAFGAYLAPGLAEALAVPLADIALRSEALIFACVAVALTALAIASVVLSVWWWRHRYVGPVLQAL